ncbi:VOC family protein [Danxiaibacter flavus]|uniref:VOC family protein n=1 Tax=Danxiaibacter flavus TaxID=3049108 RepID=A0ABV3ZBK9_9BACT|nr:VOC family protein [Chitinophagaceae bacterium DXS]
MKQAISFITIGAENLEKLKQFYIDVFEWKPVKDENGIVFFKMNSFILALFPADELAEDIGIHHDGQGFKQFTLAINLSSEKEVDDIFAQLISKGVSVVKEPQKIFWGGYAGYIADIENNYWEIVYNPFVELDGEGNVVTHK